MLNPINQIRTEFKPTIEHKVTLNTKYKTQNTTNPILGAHFSIAKGLHEAVYQARSYDCNALQMFTKNATAWKERTITQLEQDRFEQARTETGIHAIASHTSYLINLASPDSKKDLGSRVDRHTHIGKGALGVSAFRHLLNDERLLHVPKFLETAHTEGNIDWTQRNLDLLRSLTPN
jgi:endonuclease IV